MNVLLYCLVSTVPFPLADCLISKTWLDSSLQLLLPSYGALPYTSATTS